MNQDAKCSMPIATRYVFDRNQECVGFNQSYVMRAHQSSRFFNQCGDVRVQSYKYQSMHVTKDAEFAMNESD